MRGQVVLIALLGAAPGHSPSSPARLGARWPQPASSLAVPASSLAVPAFLAPSPYEPALAPDPPFAPVELARARPVRAPQAPVSQAPSGLAPSPYALLLPDPYEDHSPPGGAASTPRALAAAPNPLALALAPSPYERGSQGELAPSPY